MDGYCFLHTWYIMFLLLKKQSGNYRSKLLYLIQIAALTGYTFIAAGLPLLKSVLELLLKLLSEPEANFFDSPH